MSKPGERKKLRTGVEDLKFTNAPEYPWIMPQFASIGYEGFFADGRAYYDPDAMWMC